MPLCTLLSAGMSTGFSQGHNNFVLLAAPVLQDVSSLQYEAGQLAEKAEAEKCTVLAELDRLHKLVASFQAQISEVGLQEYWDHAAWYSAAAAPYRMCIRCMIAAPCATLPRQAHLQ